MFSLFSCVLFCPSFFEFVSVSPFLLALWNFLLLLFAAFCLPSLFYSLFFLLYSVFFPLLFVLSSLASKLPLIICSRAFCQDKAPYFPGPGPASCQRAAASSAASGPCCTPHRGAPQCPASDCSRKAWLQSDTLPPSSCPFRDMMQPNPPLPSVLETTSFPTHHVRSRNFHSERDSQGWWTTFIATLTSLLSGWLSGYG